MNEALQALEVKVENGGATPQGKFLAKDWNTLVEAVKALDLAELDEASLRKFLKDNDYITSEDVPEVDLSAVVTLATEQRITGTKDFVGGIKVNGQPLIYNAELGVWQMEGDLLVTGGVAWFASIKGFKPSTIMDAIKVDGETIVINANGELTVIGGGSGGSGGGLTISDLSNYLTTNKYTKQSDVESLIATALTGYATQSWVEDKKYLTGITSSQVTTALGYTPYNSSNPDKYIKGIDYDMVIAALGYTPYSNTNPMGYLTISSLTGYATEQWVGENYLAKSGGTIEGVLELNSTNAARSIRFNTTFGSSWLFVNSGEWYVTNIGRGAEYKLIHSNNISSYNAGSATKLATPRTIWGNSFDGTSDINGGIGFTSSQKISWFNDGANYYIAGAGVDGDAILEYKAYSGHRFLGGNVAVGRTTADAKLHVGGVAKIDSSLFVGNTQSSLHAAWLSYSGICATGSGLSGWLAEFGNGTQGVLLGCRGNNLSVPSIGTVNATDLSILPDGGNVVIGGTIANEKLHIKGNARVDGVFNINGAGVMWSDGWSQTAIGSEGHKLYFTASEICVRKDSNNQQVLMSIDTYGNTTINGNFFVNGNVSWVSQSQRSLKHIVSEQGLSLAQLERIKPIKFYWKDGRDAVLHVGGVADVYAEVLPEVVSHWKNTLCLNYVDASFYTAASLIAPVVDHERRIAQLERENEALKQKLNQLAA